MSPRLRTIRNLLIAAVVVAALVAGYLWLRKQKYEFSITMPEFSTIVRGDLNITITASGVVRPVNSAVPNTENAPRIAPLPFHRYTRSLSALRCVPHR